MIRGPEAKTTAVSPERAEAIIAELAERLEENYPFHHPVYAGQMLKPAHPIANLAYALAQRINPNNHALDGGTATAPLAVSYNPLRAPHTLLDTVCRPLL